MALFKEHDAFLVPTLITYRALAEEGVAAGLPVKLSCRKFEWVTEHGQMGLPVCRNDIGMNEIGWGHVDSRLDQYRLALRIRSRRTARIPVVLQPEVDKLLDQAILTREVAAAKVLYQKPQSRCRTPAQRVC